MQKKLNRLTSSLDPTFQLKKKGTGKKTTAGEHTYAIKYVNCKQRAYSQQALVSRSLSCACCPLRLDWRVSDSLWLCCCFVAESTSGCLPFFSLLLFSSPHSITNDKRQTHRRTPAPHTTHHSFLFQSDLRAQRGALERRAKAALSGKSDARVSVASPRRSALSSVLPPEAKTDCKFRFVFHERLSDGAVRLFEYPVSVWCVV